MKILLVHNNYGAYSGEEAVVDKMAAIYRSLGYCVKEYRRSTKAIQHSLSGKISALICGVFPRLCLKEFLVTLERFSPDVVHIHNLYPFIGAAILKECKKRGVKVIMTVHNYRLICPTGLFMRDCKPCEVCLSRGDEWGCVGYNCEGSLPKSIGYALRNYVARKRRYYLDSVDKYLCLTEFQRSKLIAAGFDATRIEVIPNSIDISPQVSISSGNYIGYCGRLSAEKGVDMIVEVARRNPEIEFRLAGSARSGFSLGEIPSNCKLVGHLSGDRFAEFISAARFLVMASRCYEGFPISILEAASYGKCTLAPNHGAFTEIINNMGDPIGELFVPNDIDDLERKILALWADRDRTTRYAKSGAAAVKNRYSFDVVQEQWQSAINALFTTD